MPAWSLINTSVGQVRVMAQNVDVESIINDFNDKAESYKLESAAHEISSENHRSRHKKLGTVATILTALSTSTIFVGLSGHVRL
jgi:hypothetical protein